MKNKDTSKAMAILRDPAASKEVASNMDAAITGAVGSSKLAGLLAAMTVCAIMTALEKIVLSAPAVRAVRVAMDIWFEHYEKLAPVLEEELAKVNETAAASDIAPDGACGCCGS